MNRVFVEQKIKTLETEVDRHRKEAENHRANAESAEWEAEKAETALAAWVEMLNEIDTSTDNHQPASQAEMALVLPVVTLGQALEDAARVLGNFTKGDLAGRIKLNHPKLEFAAKSLDKPLHALIDSGRVAKVRDSVGHNPAVYQYK